MKGLAVFVVLALLVSVKAQECNCTTIEALGSAIPGLREYRRAH